MLEYTPLVNSEVLVNIFFGDIVDMTLVKFYQLEPICSAWRRMNEARGCSLCSLIVLAAVAAPSARGRVNEFNSNLF